MDNWEKTKRNEIRNEIIRNYATFYNEQIGREIEDVYDALRQKKHSQTIDEKIIESVILKKLKNITYL